MPGVDVLSQDALFHLDASRKSPFRAHAIMQVRHINLASDAEDQRRYGFAVRASVIHPGPSNLHHFQHLPLTSNLGHPHYHCLSH